MSKFKEILSLCEKSGFLRLNNSDLQLGPIGYLLRENLKTEWLYSNVTNRDINVFLNSNSSFGETFDFVKNISEEKSPFGVAQITSDNTLPNNIDTSDVDADVIDRYFNAPNQMKLDCFVFVPPSMSVQYFHNWQRQRRMWWRKFSASPGRYSLTDIEISAENEQNVEITSSYPWGSHIMERIYLYSNRIPFLTEEQQQVKDGRKRVQCHCVLSTTYLNTMVLNTLCDVFDEIQIQDTQRHLLRFHRKIAPYKISFAVTSNSNNADELYELGLYLCRKLRANNISVLFLSNRNSLETQWNQFDQLGIPYCVVLNDGTLRNGVAQLRNRDTTLKEQVHISDLLEYVEKLFKNY